MSKLDFSGINRIAYKGFEDQPEERDSLLQAGYTLVDGIELPFDQKPQEQPKPEPAAQASAFSDHTGSRDYKTLYRVAFDFHRDHHPPTVNREYWRTHEPGIDDTPPEEIAYWERMAQDMGSAAAKVTGGGSDKLLIDLLIAVTDELEREYKACREEAHSTGSEKPQKAS